MLQDFFVPPHVHHGENETFHGLDRNVHFIVDDESGTGGPFAFRPRAFKIISPLDPFLTSTNGTSEKRCARRQCLLEEPEIPQWFLSLGKSCLESASRRSGTERSRPPCGPGRRLR